MELLNAIVDVPYVFHYLTVSGVLLGAILLFVFGFKPTEEPSFGKIKTDSKLNPKKKKGKEKKSVSGSPKANVAVKTKASKSDEKPGRRSGGPLKDSKNVNTGAKEINDEFVVKERKKKGKENVDFGNDQNDEDGEWERAFSRKDRKNKKGLNFNEVPKRNSAKNSNHASDASSKKESENMKNKSTQKEKKQRINDNEDLGAWQEAKASKKRRRIQKDAAA